MSLITLPADAEARAENFPRLSATTKHQLLETLKSKTPEDQTRILQTILRQSGAASEFFHHVLAKESDSRVPQNKRLNPIQTK
jgi:hypothetical protein